MRILSRPVQHSAQYSLAQPEPLFYGVIKELITVKIRTTGKKVKTLWLSPRDVSYKYERVVYKPKPINGFRKIVELMNSNKATSGIMTACLVLRVIE